MNCSGDRSATSVERGQSALIGFVILLGLVAVASAGLLIVGGEALTETERQAEEERVLQAFTELSQNMLTVSENGDVSRSINLDAGEHGAVVKTDTATLTITGGDIDKEISIGAIEYEGDGGTKIAYQGGAVFHETGKETRVVSAPPVYFDKDAESLSFRIVKAKNEAELGSGDITVRHTGETDPFSEASIVEDDTVTIEVDSEYCLGWEKYFRDQTGAISLQYSCFDDENEDGVVAVQLGYTDVDGAFSSGVALAERDNYEEHNSGGELDDVSSNSFLPLDSVITRMYDDFSEEETDLTTEDLDEIGGGKYFVKEGALDGEESLTFNLEDEDAIVVVNDDISGYDITVSSCGDQGEKQAKIYATGDFNIDNNEFRQECGSDDSNLQIYGTSEMAIDFGNGYYQGTIYAASDKELGVDGFEGWDINNNDPEYQAYAQGSPEFDGSLIVHSLSEGSNFHDFNTHSLEDADISVIPDGYEPAPQLTYLNLAEHQIEIEEN